MPIEGRTNRIGFRFTTVAPCAAVKPIRKLPMSVFKRAQKSESLLASCLCVRDLEACTKLLSTNVRFGLTDYLSCKSSLIERQAKNLPVLFPPTQIFLGAAEAHMLRLEALPHQRRRTGEHTRLGRLSIL